MSVFSAGAGLPAIDSLVVLAKAPVPGRVKTRLSPPFSDIEAAELAAAALTDTLDAVEAMPVGRRFLAFDGDAEGWLRPGWTHVAQPAGDLATRMGAAFAAVGAVSAALVAMDTPQLHAAAFDGFDPAAHDACIGLTRDGGYWTIGLRDASTAAAVLTGVPMSTPQTGQFQLQRLRELGLRTHLLEPLIDIDDADDARDVAAAAPATRFAETLRRLTRTPAQAESR